MAYSLPADRNTTWNPGLNSVGGIPYRSTIFATLSPSGGDDTTTIQNSLNSAAAIATQNNPQVVKLNAGTFNISGQGLTVSSYVVLRGAGPDLTKIIRTDAATAVFANIIVGPRWGSDKFGTSTNLTSNAVKGSNSVTVASAAGLTAGTLVHIDELNDFSRVWLSEAANAWFSRLNRNVSQRMEIASVNGTTVTFTTPFHVDFRTSQTAQLTPTGSAGQPVRWAGVEDIYTWGGKGGDGGGNFLIVNGMYCWIKHVESDTSNGAGAGFSGCFRCEIRDSYIHNAWQNQPGGSEYMFQVDYGSADCLIENNIAWSCGKAFVYRSSGGGNVAGYNYADDVFIGYSPTFVESGLQAAHQATPHMELFEGNQSFNFDSDITHGNSFNIIAFRNHLTGRRRGSVTQFHDGSAAWTPITLSDGFPRSCIRTSANTWWFSFVGNVLGTATQTLSPQTSAVYDFTGAQGSETYMLWMLGNGGGNHWNDPPDPLAVSTTIRHGNYNFAAGTVPAQLVWDPASSDHVIPDSLYLSSKPAFFGASSWPWVTPENATKTAVLPARQRFDAGTPNAVSYTAPSAMELLSRSLPATSSAGTASHGQDANYGGPLWGFTSAQIGNNGWLRYDMTSITAAKRSRMLVAIYQSLGDGQHQINFRQDGDAQVWQNVAGAYVVETAASSSGPWTARATVTQNCQHYRTHLIENPEQHNWIQFRATSSTNGAPYVNLDVYSAPNGVTDGFVFYGDSITNNLFGGWYNGFPPEWFSKQVTTSYPAFFPPIVGGGYPFMTAADAVGMIVDKTGSFVNGLDQALRVTYTDVKYACLAYGANDAPSQGVVDQFRANYTAIINALRAQNQVVVVATPTWATDPTRQAGLVQIRGAIGYHLPNWSAGTFASGAYVWNSTRAYRCTTSGTSVSGPTGTGTGIADGGTARWSYVPSLKEDYATDPFVIGGPDLYTVFLNQPAWFSDGLHPNDTGMVQLRSAWVNWATSTLYAQTAHVPALVPGTQSDIAPAAELWSSRAVARIVETNVLVNSNLTPIRLDSPTLPNRVWIRVINPDPSVRIFIGHGLGTTNTTTCETVGTNNGVWEDSIGPTVGVYALSENGNPVTVRVKQRAQSF